VNSETFVMSVRTVQIKAGRQTFMIADPPPADLP
jgi:hypothetical protein